MTVLAEELNETLKGSVAFPFLSERGREMYFPKGIVSQAAEAGSKAKRFNATVGTATENGQPFHLRDIFDEFKEGSFSPKDIFSYAPGGGDKELREVWKNEMINKNPGLKDKEISFPIVTGGLTHTISIIATLFVNPGDEVVTPNLFWDNYELIFETLTLGKLRTFEFFDKTGKFNSEGMKKALLETKGETCRVILNFPNNPTGYTPTEEEMESIVKALKEVAKKKKVLAILDDAYYGLFFEDEVAKECLFSYLADSDENIFAIKGDAATKEEMVWGFRIGFITYASKGLNKAQLDALEKKTLGAVRCTVSNCDRPGQTLLLRALRDGKNRNRDKAYLFDQMKDRYSAMKKALEDKKDNNKLTPYPFNSGYFMAFSTNGKNAEELRVYLLDKYEIGAINILGHTLRLAYCSVEKDKIPSLIDTLYKAVDEIW